MKTIDTWKELTTNTLSEMGRTFMEVLPNILGALLILLVGWLLTKLVVLILKRILKFAKADKLTEIINDKVLSGKTTIKFNVITVIVVFVKWILFLAFLIIAADIMNWEIVSREVGNLMQYLPKLFSAIALFIVGLYIANFVKKAIMGVFETFDLRGSKLVGTLVFYIIAFIITVTALNQAGINTEIITNNATIILGAFLAAVALLRTSYARKNFKIGQKIVYKEISGTIVSMENLTIAIDTTEGLLFVPVHKITNEDIMVSEE